MKHTKTFFLLRQAFFMLLLAFLPQFILAQFAYELDGRLNYNQVTWLMAHNGHVSFNTGYTLAPNQTFTIAEQLDFGVRAFGIDTYSKGNMAEDATPDQVALDILFTVITPPPINPQVEYDLLRNAMQDNAVYMLHNPEGFPHPGIGFPVSVAGYESHRFGVALTTIGNFLINNPDEIVTIGLENRASDVALAAELSTLPSNIRDLIFQDYDNLNTSSLNQLRASGKRLILMSTGQTLDVGGQNIILGDTYDFFIENTFSDVEVGDPDAQGCTNRSNSDALTDPTDKSYIFNHFWTFGNGPIATIVNTAILNRLDNTSCSGVPLPNFVHVDHVESGYPLNALGAVRALNRQRANTTREISGQDWYARNITSPTGQWLNNTSGLLKDQTSRLIWHINPVDGLADFFGYREMIRKDNNQRAQVALFTLFEVGNDQPNTNGRDLFRFPNTINGEYKIRSGIANQPFAERNNNGEYAQATDVGQNALKFVFVPVYPQGTPIINYTGVQNVSLCDEAKTINLADIFTIECINGLCGSISITNISPSSITFQPEDIGTPVEDITIHYSYETVSGIVTSSATYALIFNVSSEAPTFECPENQVLELDESGNVTIPPISGVTFSPNSFDCSEIGTHTVTATKTSNDCSYSCEFQVTVKDNTLPIAECQDILVELNEDGLGSAAASAVNDGSSDACGIANLSLSQSNFNCNHIGVNTVILRVKDVNGNISGCVANIQVVDLIKPEAECQDVTVQLDGDGNGSTTPEAVNNNSTDACGIADLTLSQTDFDCSHVGENTATLEVVDVNENMASCTATIIVVDQIKPVAKCQDVTIQLDGDGNGSTTAEAVNNNSTDACGIADLTLSQTDFDCSHVGENTVTLNVVDVNQNMASCTASIIVVDQVEPEANCQNVTIQLDGDGNGSTTAEAINDDSTDACGIENLSLSQTDFTCDNLGENTVILTVTDQNDNPNTCEATVTVVDNIKPTISCISNINVENDTEECGAEVIIPMITASDNCTISTIESRFRLVDENGGNLGPWSSWSPDHSGFFAVGRYKLRWRAIDNSGNQRGCTRYITVNDTEKPVVDCFDQVITFNGQESIDLNVNNFATASDNCAVLNTSLDINNISCEALGETIIITATSIDIYGNAQSCTSSLYVDGLPCGWSQTPDGVGCEDGSEVSYDVTTETFTVSSTDCYNDISNTSDEYAFASYNLCGNGTIITKVNSVNGNTNGWAGITIRESNDPQAPLVALLSNGSSNHRREIRSTHGGNVTAQLMPAFNRHWLKLYRTGNNIRGYTSSNGSSWFLRFSATVPMGDCTVVGLVVNGYTAGSDIDAIFSNVSIQGESFFNPLQGQATADENAMEVMQSRITNGQSLSLYPNPSRGDITMDLGQYSGQVAAVDLFDLNGKKIESISTTLIETPKIQLDLKHLPSGVYLMRLRLNDGTIKTQKLVLDTH